MGGGQQPHNSMISYNTGQQPMARYPQGGQPPPQVPPGGAYNSQYGPQYQVYKSYFSKCCVGFTEDILFTFNLMYMRYCSKIFIFLNFWCFEYNRNAFSSFLSFYETACFELV